MPGRERVSGDFGGKCQDWSTVKHYAGSGGWGGRARCEWEGYAGTVWTVEFNKTLSCGGVGKKHGARTKE